MQEGIIIVSLTLLSSVVTISRFLYEYRNRCSCGCTRTQSDIVEGTPPRIDTPLTHAEPKTNKQMQ